MLHHRLLESSVPVCVDLDTRIAMTLRCPDLEGIPRDPGAGIVFDLPDGRRVQRMHNGILVAADGYGGPWMTSLIEQGRGCHEPQEERVFHELMKCLPPGGSMLELGGYWAFYSLWFLRSGAGRRTILVEPDPAHMAVGIENFALNGLEGEFLSGFVGGNPGTVAPFKTDRSGILSLPCLDVPQLLAERNIDRLTILHCDTQGAELAVLEQCADLFRQRRIDWVFLSTHHHSISSDALTHQRCLVLLQSLGAKIEVEHDVHESYSGDGFICARFCDAPEGWNPPAISYNRTSTSLFRNPLIDLAIMAHRAAGK